MSSSSFFKLPSELIETIFEYVDSFAQVAALNQTAPIFHDVWVLRGPIICQAIVGRLVPCLPEARELLEFQDYLGDEQRQQRMRNSEIKFRSAKQLLSNAREVSKDSDLFRRRLNNRAPIGESRLFQWTPQDRIRFIHTRYRIWTLAEMCRNGSSPYLPESFLASMDFEELFHVEMMAWYLWWYCPSEDELYFPYLKNAKRRCYQSIESYIVDHEKRRYRQSLGLRLSKDRIHSKFFRLVPVDYTVYHVWAALRMDSGGCGY
ncbi:hypothetical protein MMC06_005012 [Schaereria dolodes]|nr:hypothetical protein [Schaereria dolodes]